MNDNSKSSARLLRLHRRAAEVRETALSHSGDLVGWRLSRLMREATTDAEADEAERRLSVWEASAESPACPMCGSHVDRGLMAAGPTSDYQAHTFECRACSFNWIARVNVDLIIG